MQERPPHAGGLEAGPVLAELLRQSAEGMLAALQDMTDDELRARPHGLAPALWQVGHVALSDARLAERAGEPLTVPEGWAALFGRGTSGEGALPSREEVLHLFRQANERLVALCSGDLARTVESPPGRVAVLANRLAFQIFHRGYHYGKVMTPRALLGKPRLLG